MADQPEDHSHPSHVPLTGGKPTTVSPKQWLVDIAWQAVNQMEWDDMILEITENRHGAKSGAACPGQLLTIEGVKTKGRCDGKFCANYFHSWCGDFATWVFWKAWVLKGKPEDKVSKAELGKFLNRETLNGSWTPGANLSMVEDYAKTGGLLTWHTFGDGYVPSPGDHWFSNRGSGGHIGIVASIEDKTDANNFTMITLDGKSWDGEWFKGLAAAQKEAKAQKQPQPTIPERAQGVARNRRKSNESEPTDTSKKLIKGFVDTSKLRQALGYR